MIGIGLIRKVVNAQNHLPAIVLVACSNATAFVILQQEYATMDVVVTQIAALIRYTIQHTAYCYYKLLL